MRKALAFSKSQKMSMIVLIIMTCAVLFLSQGQVSNNTYWLAIFGWPLVIFCLNLVRPNQVEIVSEEGAADEAKDNDKKGKKKKNK